MNTFFGKRKTVNRKLRIFSEYIFPLENWKKMRDEAGLTLEELAERTGYGISTISGLERLGEGSVRLKKRVREVLSPVSKVAVSEVPRNSESAIPGVAPRAEPAENLSITECNRRIQELETMVAELRIALRAQARELSSAPPSAAGELLKRAGEDYDQPHPPP